MGLVVRREVRKKFDSAEDAGRYRKLLERALSRVDADYSIGLSACPTILEGLEKFLADPLIFNGVSGKRLSYYRRVLSRFAADLSRGAGDIAVDKISYDDLVDWLARRFREPGNRGKYVESDCVCAGTVANEIKALKRFADWCWKRRYCSRDIDIFRLEAIRVSGRNKRHDQFPPRALHERDFMAVLKKLKRAAPRIELVLRAMIMFGARPKAVFLISMSDYSPPSSRIDGEIRLKALKGGSPSAIRVARGSFLHGFVEEVLDYARAVYAARGLRLSSGKAMFPNLWGRRWRTSPFDRALRAAARRLHIWDFTAYQARHSAITWLKRQGMSPLVVQHYAKHLAVDTQEVYDWTTNEEAAPAYEAIAARFSCVPARGVGAAVEDAGERLAPLMFMG